MAKEPDDGGPGDENTSNVHDGGPQFPRSVLEREFVYESLAHVRRRYLCCLLCGRSELRVDEAVSAIATWETEDGADISTSTRDRIRLALLHSHIPKLREHDVVDFDHHSGIVVPDENADAVLTALKAVGTRLSPEPTCTDSESA
ncbi:DUF7344 domain-containing protein [Haloarcula salinisoli]|uniref:DUF7344 domain-containing protein n=1 Tax=Haloarcula salinisoli TaxID=2487746 RepID=A0A8J7YGK7_9EURY|nr:hypothetical protein [Halomicroarcula salinisoli]MBX0286168.1 hypothetical protein [Halomicroarcula salinisoli]MBX0302344.1 hypothetical protein [Halomicroarcula salinisoli]